MIRVEGREVETRIASQAVVRAITRVVVEIYHGHLEQSPTHANVAAALQGALLSAARSAKSSPS